ncbi:hypothetical protein [Deinococcus soli (ex Cha et al. 2016)]|uniref:hypothetical protein n=1 Tax=Deinococcus soli (ex Cha et al. 2016) TaxID=1309411 RepID=UPI00166A2ACC|nr:hypothetical protein [Deinococcus soli (ex Cha et al. 2016)]
MKAITVPAAALLTSLLLGSCGTSLPLPGGATPPTQILTVKLTGASTTTVTVRNTSTNVRTDVEAKDGVWKGPLARGTYAVSVGAVDGRVTPAAQTADLTSTDQTLNFTYQAAPPAAATFTLQGRSVTAGNDLVYGGADIKVQLSPLPEGAAVAWRVSRGDITPGEAGSATIPYSATNREQLTGGELTVTAETGGQTYRTTLRVDDAAPTADGGVLLTLPGGQKSVLTSGDELPLGTTFEATFQDSGVGMAPVTFATWRSGLPVQTTFTTTDQLTEASQYELRSSGIQDRLGNRVGSEDGVLGTFGTDYHAPDITADRASGSVLAPLPTDGTGTTEDALTFQVSDPRRVDGSAGSGLRRVTVSPAGTVAGSVVTVTHQQLRKAGVTGTSAAVTVTATDEAGNAAVQTLTVTLP